MARLLIIGAGGFGREVLQWANDISVENKKWSEVHFLDSNIDALSSYEVDYKIIGDPVTYHPKIGDLFVCAIGDPSTKLKICRGLLARGAKFINLFHPTAVIGERCSIGVGCIICPGAVITADVKIGNFVSVNALATIGHDATIGEGCTLSGHVDITGFARIGEGAFLGSHASVLPRANVGGFAVVGAGSVVLQRVKPGATVIGVPAKQIAGF